VSPSTSGAASSSPMTGGCCNSSLRVDIAIQSIATRRAFECRLTPDRALETLEEASAFLAARGLLTLTPDCALPSLFGACHEEPWSDAPGFGTWPKTKYWWGVALPARATKLHKGKTLFVSDTVARAIAPLCRSELEAAREGKHGEDERRFVEHLAAAGPSTTEELKEELSLDARTFRRARARLERVGAVVSRGLIYEHEGAHHHTSEHRLWDVTGAGDEAGALRELFVAGVRAAVLAPEREALRWFSWRVPEEALEDERVERPEPGWLTAA
jgi:hypothetical protein